MPTACGRAAATVIAHLTSTRPGRISASLRRSRWFVVMKSIRPSWAATPSMAFRSPENERPPPPPFPWVPPPTRSRSTKAASTSCHNGSTTRQRTVGGSFRWENTRETREHMECTRDTSTCPSSRRFLRTSRSRMEPSSEEVRSPLGLHLSCLGCSRRPRRGCSPAPRRGR